MAPFHFIDGTILIVALIVVFVARGLSAAVSRPVGLLEAGASGVATSVGVASCFFAFASYTVSFLLFIDKVSVEADNHVSLTMINIVDAGLQGVVAFAEVGSQGVARYAARLVSKVEFEIFHAFFRIGDRFVIRPVVAVNFFRCHLFTRNQVLPFLFRLETPERRVVGVFFGKDFLATFLVVARIWIGRRYAHWLTPAWITIRTLVYVAFGFHLLWIGAFSTSDGTFVILLVERVELVMEPFPLSVDAPVHDGVIVDVVVAPQFAVQAFAADGLVGTARLVAAYGNGLFGFAGDAFVDSSLSGFIIGACVFVVRAFAATVVARVARFIAAAFGHLLAVFAASDCRVEIFIFGTSLFFINTFTAVRSFIVTGNRTA